MPVVDCEASYNFTGLDVEYFGNFAIGLDTTVELKVDVGGVYNLYPSIKEHRGYMSNYVSLNGALGRFLMYWNPVYTTFGVAVKDKTCFSKVIDTFVIGKDLVRECEMKSFWLKKPRFQHIAPLYFVE